MSASTGALARLLEQATPEGDWSTVYETKHGVRVARLEPPIARNTFQAALISLAPDAVRLLVETFAKLGLLDHREQPCEGECVTSRNIVLTQIQYDALLARFAALEERAAQ